jgi:hypothetical protein
MGFSDFKGIWKVTKVQGADELLGHWVAIGGVPTAVKVICIHDHKHINADLIYQEAPEQLTGGTVTITRLPGTKNEIFCDSGLAPGSWTAEDNLG